MAGGVAKKGAKPATINKAEEVVDKKVEEVQEEDENYEEEYEGEGDYAEGVEGEEGDQEYQEEQVEGEGEGEGEEDETLAENDAQEGGEDGDDQEDDDAEGGDGDDDAAAADGDEKAKDDKDQPKPFDLDEVLQTKIKFKDDTEGFVFSRGPKYSEDKWPVNCHVCRLGNLLTKDQVKSHVRSRRHFIKAKRKWVDAEQYNSPFLQCADKSLGLDKPIKIYPGESIEELTSELEEERLVKNEDFEVKKPPEDIIKELSDEPMHEYNKKLPLIGLCYMYKMKGRNGISYYCTLCNMKIKVDAFKHVTSISHQYKYIERHFPKFYDRVVERLRKERSVDLKKSISNIFRKLYRKIENAKGFREITFVDDDEFYKNRKRYLLKTRFDDHYDEKTILITEQEVDILIRKCINRMDFIKPDLKTIDKSSKGRENRENSSRSRPPKRPPPPRYRDTRDDEDDPIWERYQYIMDREIDNLNQEYQEYDRIPRKHPYYYSEERMFFKGAGNDQRKIRNLKRDWMPFWRRRLRQLYEDDLAKRKLRVKRELRLRTDTRTPSPINTSSRRRLPSSRRTPSPSGYDRRYADRPGPRDIIMDTLPQTPSEPLGVISVLRLLTALEDQLGSLGPKAVQLMSKAVLAEKSDQNPNDLMMENEVYVFFVTAKEKLKGQLFANIVEPAIAGAVNRAVADTTTLLDMFEDYLRRTGKRPVAANSSNDQYNPAPVPPPSNQYISSSQSNQYRSGGGSAGGTGSQFTTDTNGSANQYSSGMGGGNSSSYSALPTNQYQTGSGSGYGTAGGSGGGVSSGMNQYSTGTGGSGVNQYSSGTSGTGGSGGGQYNSPNQYRTGGPNQGGIWQSGGNSSSYSGSGGGASGSPFLGGNKSGGSGGGGGGGYGSRNQGIGVGGVRMY